MAIVHVSKDFAHPGTTVRIAEELDPKQAPQQPQSDGVNQSEDLINKQKIIGLVQDHQNKIDRLTVTEEKGGKKKVQFEVSPQGILRPQQAQQPAAPGAPAPAPAPAEAPAPAMPAPAAPVGASTDAMEKTAKGKKGKKKDWNPNPWAVCHTTVDKEENPEKYERCVMDVKEKQASVEFPEGFLNKMGIGE